MGPQKNHLNEIVLLSIQKYMLNIIGQKILKEFTIKMLANQNLR